MSDLRSYWSLLSDRGILFGDDYPWPGVRSAVNCFAREAGADFEIAGRQWMFRKSRQERPPMSWTNRFRKTLWSPF